MLPPKPVPGHWPPPPTVPFRTVLSGYGPHTAAKHRILRRYFEAWLPIMGQGWGRGGRAQDELVVIDGFAGSGRYDTGECGSPLVLLDAYRNHAALPSISQTLRLIFIEKEDSYVRHLRSELDAQEVDGLRVELDVRPGVFATQFPAVVAELESRHGTMPPTFAFLDPFGLKDNTLDLTSSLAVRKRCEVLAYLPTGFMARYESTAEFARGLDNLYGDRSQWEGVREIENFEERRMWLRDRFGEVLAAQTGGRCLGFDIQPEGSSNIYSLVFSSQSRRGLQRMKEAMWKVDPVSGQFFRGGLRRRQSETLFAVLEDTDELSFHGVSGEPDYERLEKLLRDRFADREFSIEQAADYTLYETVFRDDAHLKRPTLGRMEKAGALRVVSSSRARPRAGDYPAGTVVRFCGA